MTSEGGAKSFDHNLRDPLVFLATGFGIGRVPKIPGTAGSLVAAIVWLVVLANTSPFVQSVALLIAIVIGYTLLTLVERRYEVGDEPSIVIDEIVGMWIALYLLPAVWWIYCVAFVGFRLFDIWKPFPVGWIDKSMHGSAGILLDDVVAGAMACVIAHAIWKLTLGV